MKNIFNKLAIGVLVFFVVIIGISFMFGKPQEEIIVENNKRIEKFNEEKESIEKVDVTLKELSDQMYNLTISISNDLENNSLNVTDVLSRYKALGDKATIDTEKILDLPLKVSIQIINKNIVDYVKISMDGITNMDTGKLATAIKYMENVTKELDNYIILKEDALKTIDKRIEYIENNTKSLE